MEIVIQQKHYNFNKQYSIIKYDIIMNSDFAWYEGEKCVYVNESFKTLIENTIYKLAAILLGLDILSQLQG